MTTFDTINDASKSIVGGYRLIRCNSCNLTAIPPGQVPEPTGEIYLQCDTCRNKQRMLFDAAEKIQQVLPNLNLSELDYYAIFRAIAENKELYDLVHNIRSDYHYKK